MGFRVQDFPVEALGLIGLEVGKLTGGAKILWGWFGLDSLRDFGTKDPFKTSPAQHAVVMYVDPACQKKQPPSDLGHASRIPTIVPTQGGVGIHQGTT